MKRKKRRKRKGEYVVPDIRVPLRGKHFKHPINIFTEELKKNVAKV